MQYRLITQAETTQNTGHLAQAQRPAHYKALLDTDPDNTHILAVDYRGFGLSTGAPSEAGLITDGIATVNWALEKAGVSPERMVLVGNSLGTGVATATMEHFAVHASPPVPIRALVLLSGFANIPTLMKTYMIGGVVPVLSPLNTYPDLQKWIGEHVVDTWDSARRLTSIAKSGSKFNLVLVHARDDWDIVWKHSVLLYHAVVDQWVGRYDECRAATGKDDDEYQAAEYETGTVRKHLFDHGESHGNTRHSSSKMAAPCISLHAFRGFTIKVILAMMLPTSSAEYDMLVPPCGAHELNR
ncbi:hypothetical protein MRB53_037299 [Persea americana]|nr:hypothetical protein MRB53_037299 [Persea americana]